MTHTMIDTRTEHMTDTNPRTMTLRDTEALSARALDLAEQGFNGIDFVLVSLVPAGNPREARLEVHFHNTNRLDAMVNDVGNDPRATARMFPIHGGGRIRGGLLNGQVRVTGVARGPEKTILTLSVAPVGDHSRYTLMILQRDMDPLFAEIDFRFRPGCYNHCPPEWAPPRKPVRDPPIDYLARDYDSFKHTLISRMMERVPGWRATSEADLDMVLLELFAHAADELSDFQDRIMNEAYLGTARKRVSLARHARLMDYHIHQGNQASTWLALRVTKPMVMDGEFEVWTGDERKLPDSVVFLGGTEPGVLFRVDDAEGTIRDHLDEGTVPSPLVQAFRDHGIHLSSTTMVTSADPGMGWLLSDGENHHVHFLRRHADGLEVHHPRFHHLLNQMGLHDWGGSVTGLRAGSITADLRITGEGDRLSALAMESLFRDGGITTLLIQEWLNPDNGIPAGRDRSKRQLLRLVPGNSKRDRERRASAFRDPVTDRWFVRVNWIAEDALTRSYCFTTACRSGVVEGVSLFHGNLMRVSHGEPETLTFREPGSLLTGMGDLHFLRTRNGEAICTLPPDHLLAYTDTPPGGEVPPRSTLQVVVEYGGGSDPWDEVISLIHSDASDEKGDHFVVETDENGRSRIRFGNGVNGRRLPQGAAVRCRYQVGRGIHGNIGADTLVNRDAIRYPGIMELWNPFDILNGRDPEPAPEVIRRAPEAFRSRQLRAVTLQDYVDRVQEIEGVSRATARYLWTGSWRTVRIAVDPVGTTVLGESLRQRILHHLEACRLLGEDIEIRPPLHVPVDISLSIRVLPGYWREDIGEVLEMEFSDGFTPDGRRGFFHPDRWTFGQELRASHILGRVQGITGVDHVVSLTMKRWNDATPGTGDRIEVRPNEIITMRNDPDHREEGIITFDITGGRQ